VRVLETRPGEHGVSVKYNADGKACQIRLSAGDDFIVSEQKLSDADKLLQEGTQSSKREGGDNWAKSSFSINDLLKSDSFFSDDRPDQSLEQRSAMSSLRKRIK
jgi:hypothetical protein